MGDEKDAFYVVRKGGVIGIYKSFADCQAQASLSPLDSSISVYKGYGLSKEAESYLRSNGLKQPGFSIGASDVQDGLFGALTVCPFQDTTVPSSSGTSSNRPVNLKNYVESQASTALASDANPTTVERIQKHVVTGVSLISPSSQQKHVELRNYIEPACVASPATAKRIQKQHFVTGVSLISPSSQQKHLEQNTEPLHQVHPACQSCTIEFDGASKGNPGPAGAGAILRATDGSVWRLREGVGHATNNVAEYRSVILGLRTALQKGYTHVHVRGDSQLVCYQIEGKWRTKNENMANLCEKAKELVRKFVSCTIEQVPREFNSDADAQANRAIHLRDGVVEMDVTRS